MEDINKIIESMPIKKGIITRREYEWLKSFEKLEPHEEEKVREFEENLAKSLILNSEKVDKEKKSTIPGLLPDKKTIWKGFIEAFEFIEKKSFLQNPDTLANIEPIIKYFAKDESFFQCQNLVKSFNGKNLENNFEKGLLVIGDYGNGKTTIMSCLELLFLQNYKIAVRDGWETVKLWNELRFKGIKSHDLVTEFEILDPKQAGFTKEMFYKKFSGFRYYFDDLKKEKVASNFGKTEIVREILEKRYDAKAKTFGTCNYKEGQSGNLQQALYEFGERYGGHIYDRIFEMFNIIEFKGKSFRK